MDAIGSSKLSPSELPKILPSYSCWLRCNKCPFVRRMLSGSKDVGDTIVVWLDIWNRVYVFNPVYLCSLDWRLESPSLGSLCSTNNLDKTVVCCGHKLSRIYVSFFCVSAFVMTISLFNRVKTPRHRCPQMCMIQPSRSSAKWLTRSAWLFALFVMLSHHFSQS